MFNLISFDKTSKDKHIWGKNLLIAGKVQPVTGKRLLKTVS